jgi:hypothetical protein
VLRGWLPHPRGADHQNLQAVSCSQIKSHAVRFLKHDASIHLLDFMLCIVQVNGVIEHRASELL